MKFKPLVAVTLCLVSVTVLALAYEKSVVPPAGRQERAWKMFILRETEPSESYCEFVEPLDEWTARAIQNLTQSVAVYEKNWNQCQITNTNATVFKYDEKFYTFKRGMITRRIVTIRVEPEREICCGVYISLRETTYSPNSTVYELEDPLDPWTEEAIQDLDCTVVVDDIYHDQCALLTGERLHDVFFSHDSFVKYHDKYYTGDELAFYDGFRVTSQIRRIIGVFWILLGLVWIGSSVRNFWNSLNSV